MQFQHDAVHRGRLQIVPITASGRLGHCAAGAPGPASWNTQLHIAWRAALAATDIALLFDHNGLLADFDVTEPDLAANLLGRSEWRGQHWSSLFAPASRPVVEGLLAARAPRPGAPAQLLLHPLAAEANHPVLYQALPIGEARQVALLGRNLLGLDFARVLLLQSALAAEAYVAALRYRGASPQSLCLDLLAPAARRLGQAWMEDRCSHTDVMEATQRLESILGRLDMPGAEPLGKRILLVVPDGEQHVFGLAMAGAFFRWAGWEVRLAANGAEAEALAAAEPFAVAGFTLSHPNGAPQLRRRVSALRHASCQAGMGILVGGGAFLGRPDLASSVGADAAVADAADAVRLAGQLTDTAAPVQMMGRR